MKTKALEKLQCHMCQSYVSLAILIQVVLILSGNLSFLNWLTILPAIFCFDDKFLKCLFSTASIEKLKQLQERNRRGEKYPIGT